ncbi:MAG: hypothetical protein HQK55_12430, partial [Deltaproteobacteria bacterium]|nr:hypothetical protein [Deltaproteobacteria bacterium]
PLCPTLEDFLKVGQVAAWRCGLAHFRAGALEIWRDLPEPLARLALGFKPDAEALAKSDLAAALADPWRSLKQLGRLPERKLRLVARVGGFRGFGGPFISPPEVTCARTVIYAFDREFCYSLHADWFGSAVERFGSDLPEGVENRPLGFSLDQKNGMVTKDGQQAIFPELAGASSFAATDHTLAVTVPRSHFVYLIALADQP